jgi:hypothetical protein
MWKFTIGGIVVENSGRELQIIIQSMGGVYIWMNTSSISNFLMSCLNQICNYMLHATRLMQLVEFLVVTIIYN